MRASIVLSVLFVFGVFGTGVANAQQGATKPPADPADIICMDDVPQTIALQLSATVKKEKVAYLGISASPVPATLREQLKLQRGIGLVVDFVEDDSPAATAGLKQHDIVQKLNDQLLINTHQLSVLVRTFKAGDEVKLTIVRQGETKELTAKLAEKEMPAMEPEMFDFGAFLPPGGLPNMPPGLPDIKLPVDPRCAMFSMIMLPDGKQIIWNDQQHVLMLTVGEDDSSKHLKAISLTTGKELFDGPVGTAEQRKAVPKDVLEKLERMKNMGLWKDTKEEQPATKPSDKKD